jgi:hypothetical protein
MRGRVFVVLCTVAAMAAAVAPSAGATGFRETFNASRAGWFDGWSSGPAPWFPVGGHPGGHIAVPADQFDRTAAGTERWSGNRADAYGGEFSFDVRFDTGESGEVYAGFGSPEKQPAYYRFGARAGGPWRHYEVPMRASAAGWEATQTEIVTSLGDLGSVIIGANDVEDLYIDNVVLASNVRRRLTIGYSGGDFHGKLRPRGRCANGKRVSVFRRKPASDAKVGSDSTNSRGRYSIRSPGADGSFYAASGRSFERGTGNCLQVQSRPERVG